MRKLIPEEIKEYLSYDPETGVLTWIKRSGARGTIGTEARHLEGKGYMQTQFQRVLYKNHRIAWFLYTGEQPPDQIDHINGDKSDNRWSNLRAATQNQNQHNQGRRRDNASGYKGVSWDSTHKKWLAKIQVDSKRYSLGAFTTPEEARQAYCKAAVSFINNSPTTKEVI